MAPLPGTPAARAGSGPSLLTSCFVFTQDHSRCSSWWFSTDPSSLRAFAGGVREARHHHGQHLRDPQPH